MLLTDLTTLATGIVIGVLIGIVPAVVSVWLTGRQQHAEARFQFYRAKADTLSGYLASIYQMVEDLGDVGVNLGVMAHTVSLFPTVDTRPSLAESRANLTHRLNELKEEYENFQKDGTLLLMPEKVVVAMRDANERVHVLRNILGTTSDIEAYFRSRPDQFNYLIVQSLRSVETVKEELQRELGLKTTHQSKLLRV